jgi:hypothetical protein
VQAGPTAVYTFLYVVSPALPPGDDVTG